LRRNSAQLIVAVVLALGGALTYFTSRSTNPVTGEAQHVSLSPDQERMLGLQAMPAMAQQFGGEVNHPVLTPYVQSVGERIVRRSDAARGPYDYTFHVLADPETINAFALPGGQVSITLGLLRRLTNEAQLAGVLGHEVGHVIERHGAEQLSKQQLSQALVGAVGVATYDPNDPRSARNAAIAAAVAQLVTMRYGRKDELEADSVGVHLMAQAGYNPRGMAELMEILAKAGGGGRQAEFFSTHPNPENRLARIEEEIQAVGGAKGDVGADRFQASVLRYLREVR
jgi:predicted Zn-dependent protease